MSLAFTITYIIWALSEFLIGSVLRSKTNDQNNLDKNSLKVIWVGILVGIFLALFIASRYNFPISDYSNLEFVGISLIIIGIIFRLIIIKSLGKSFTSNVSITQNQKLKTNGFYHFLRHPSYTASLLSFIGFGISLNNWVSLIIIIAFVSIVFINRIKVEEKVLIGFFGKEYLDYKKSTKALIPFIY